MSTFAPTTKAQLQTAVNDWITNGGSTTTGTTYNNVDINAWDVSAITDMSNLFAGKTTFNSNINGWNVSNVTNMAGMFMAARIFNQPLNSWNVSKVDQMIAMFSGASAFDQNIRMWYVRQATGLNSMFSTANAMLANRGASVTPDYTWFNQVYAPPTTPIFAPADRYALDMAISAWITNSTTATTTYGIINSWDVSAITDMSDLFFGKTTFNSNIGGWNVSNVTNMSNMFCAASAFDQNIRTWHVGQWTNLQGMFGAATAMNNNRGASDTPLYTWFDDGHVPPALTGPTTRDQLIFVFSAWAVDPIAAANMYGQPNTWNVSAVTDMSSMYGGFIPWNFNADISSWNVSNVTNMSRMFNWASAFNQNIRGWSVGQSTNLFNMFSGATAMLTNQGASATPDYTWFNQGASAPTPPAPTAPSGSANMPVAFVMPTLNASYELSQALSIIGDYTAPAPYALPTITLSMPASQFNDGLFQLQLTDSYINTLVNPATEAVYYSEKITYYANQAKLPEFKDTANLLLKELPVVNGAAAKPLRQRPGALYQRLSESMVHELAYQVTGVSLMDDQIDNGAALKASIDNYLTVALPAFVRAQLAACDGKTQNISGASDLLTRANVSRELFMQIVESVVGGVNPVTGTAKSSRLNSLFDGSNLVGGKYGIKFIAGDTLRFSITIAPHSVGGVVEDIDYIVDGVQHVKQEARTVELVITMV